MANSRALSPKLLACLKFNFDSDIYSVRAVEISDFSELFSKFSSGHRGTKIKDVLPCNIFQIIVKTIPMHTTIVISCVMKRGINFWFWRRLNENWDNNMTTTSQWRESYCRTITRARKINSKQQHCESHPRIHIGKWHIWVSCFRLKNHDWISLSVPPEKVNQSLWWTLKSPKINTLADGLIENILSMLDETDLKTVAEEDDADW